MSGFGGNGGSFRVHAHAPPSAAGQIRRECFPLRQALLPAAGRFCQVKAREGSNVNICQQSNPNNSQPPTTRHLSSSGCAHGAMVLGMSVWHGQSTAIANRSTCLAALHCAPGASHLSEALAGRPASVWQPACWEVLVLYPAADGVAASSE